MPSALQGRRARLGLFVAASAAVVAILALGASERSGTGDSRSIDAPARATADGATALPGRASPEESDASAQSREAVAGAEAAPLAVAGAPCVDLVAVTYAFVDVATGDPVADLPVVFEDPGDEAPALRARSSAAGLVALELPSGTDLTLRHDAARDSDRPHWIELAPDFTAHAQDGERRVRIDCIGLATSMQVQVVEAGGAPSSFAEVEFAGEVFLADEQGRCALALPLSAEPSEDFLRARSADGLRHRFAAVDVYDAPGPLRVELAPLGRVDVTARWEDGSPASGVRARLRNAAGSDGVLDEFGSASLRGPIGDTEITFAWGKSSRTREIVVAAASRAEFDLHRRGVERVASGRITDSVGRPLPGAGVRARSPDTGKAVWASADASGRFEVWLPVCETVELVPRSSGLAGPIAPASVSVPAGTEGIEFRSTKPLDRCVVRLRPVDAASERVLGSAYLRVWHGRDTETDLVPLEGGAVTVYAVPGSRVSVTAYGFREHVIWDAARPVPSGEVDLGVVPLKRGLRFVERIRDGDTGLPIERASVLHDGRLVAVSDEEGRVTVDLDGWWPLAVFADGYPEDFWEDPYDELTPWKRDGE